MVIYWLVQSIEPSLSKQYIALNTAKDVLDNIAEQYSGENNYARGYDIRKECSGFSQGGLSLVEYYSKLTYMWQQLDSHCSFTPTNPTDAVAFQRYMDKLRVWDFVAGLNPEYDQVRVLALCKDPFPTLQKAYNLIQHEECRRSIMLPSVKSYERLVAKLESINLYISLYVICPGSMNLSIL
ncbi:UBN2_3 domain-containing protein [Cephalotus follicularis]|uniref:UBN2_3 domain-containing protein n=1 Tax=Cephalotus follicularis TaxID=3775 RepID=A0A1Q3B9V9_CEPFO|nr:UBN2_3 domain-containing protein [Cephalotus follicularis]